MTQPRHWFLLVISDRDALGWILSQQRMAFAPSRHHLIDTLTTGDRLALYTTRGCFRNPTRDRSRVIGTATVTTPLEPLVAPVTFGDREFTRGCSLRVERLARVDQGPELTALVSRLDTFPQAWAIHIRRTLVPLDSHDFKIIESALEPVGTSREEALPSYLEKIGSHGRRAARAD